jgi:trimeric autotransporter adhesin
MKTTVPRTAYVGVLLIVLTCFSVTSFSQIDFGKSYINVTKGLNGGTVEPGDTLEIRASIVVRSGTYDSCAYFDVIPAGTAYIPNTVRVLTNEGKIYKQFTDAYGDDGGWITGSNVRINLGYNSASAPATPFRRGRIANTHRPSFFGGTCIMIASFRVRVTAGYNTNISIGGGSMSYKPSSSALTSFTFPGRMIAVFQNYGICPNAIGANALGTEFNGTFGTGKPRNRGTSANVPSGYTYNIFTSNMPNDYYYGIPNNTSINTGYTTSNTWPKPDAAHRVFGVWDIIGDHTGASNPLLGNPAADTVANANSGYMLVINAAYRIDSAFQQTISNLCPNTYYEISVWMRNICSRCGCDSAGRGAGNTGYIPTTTGDSSGVYPNLSFNVNGIDYYSTGNIRYTGQWIKKGFTFRTGPAQTSFTLKVFNNAPGGGGNDWALDDISVATCSPNLAFTPTNNPTICQGNVVDVGAYIRSYFNNYTFYKWQRSINNGVTWTDASAVGTGTPVWNGTAWQYFTAFPTFVATTADSGMKFRVVVSSTAANITNPTCSFADVASVMTLNVIDCGWPLNTDLISFSGKLENKIVKLNWTTNAEDQPVSFAIEKSSDGRTFTKVGTVNGHNNKSDINYYEWNEDYNDQTYFYRIRMIGTTKQKLSRIVKISSLSQSLNFTNVPNPFSHQLVAEINTPYSGMIQLQLIDQHGKLVRSQKFAVSAGMNQIHLDHTGSLSAGLYTLQMQGENVSVNRKVVKL